MRVPIIRGQGRCLQGFVHKHRNYLVQQAFLFGCVLFRDFDTSLASFPSDVDAFAFQPASLKGSAAPRTQIGDSVYTANDSPPEQLIPMHHEMSQTLNPPEYIFFHCDLPSVEGGETPLLDSRVLVRLIEEHHPKEYAKLKYGVKYTRRMPNETNFESPIGRSWRSTFDVETEQELEAFLEASNIVYEWHPDASVTITTDLTPAIAAEVRSEQSIFRNAIIAARMGWKDDLNSLEEAVRYHDNTPISDTFMASIVGMIEQHKVMFRWERGDVLMVDNTVTMHSRNTFVPPRRLAATIRARPKIYIPSRTLPSWDVCPKFLVRAKDDVFRIDRALLKHAHGIECDNLNVVRQQLKSVARDEVFLMKTLEIPIKQSCLRFLRRLKVDAFDLCTITPTSTLEADWKDLESLVYHGKVRNIGLKQPTVSQLERVRNIQRLPISMVQSHPNNLVYNYCRRYGIRICTFPINADYRVVNMQDIPRPTSSSSLEEW